MTPGILPRAGEDPDCQPTERNVPPAGGSRQGVSGGHGRAATVWGHPGPSVNQAPFASRVPSRVPSGCAGWPWR